MNFEAEILADYSKDNALRIADHIGYNKERFADLMKVVLETDGRLQQRAYWIMNFCVEAHHDLIDPYFEVLMAQLSKPVHNAVKRNITRVFQFVPIPIKFESKLLDICFSLLADPKEHVAVRANSMTILERLTMKYPELKNELILILEEGMEHASVGFAARAKRTIKHLELKQC